MSGENRGNGRQAGAGRAEGEPSDEPGESAAREQPETDDPADRPQAAWAAQRDLRDHTPRAMSFGEGARFGGGVLGGDNHGIGGGTFHGNVRLEATTHVHYRFGGHSVGHASGEIPSSELDRLSECFAEPGPAFMNSPAGWPRTTYLSSAGRHRRADARPHSCSCTVWEWGRSTPSPATPH